MVNRRLLQDGVTEIQVIVESFTIELQVGVIDYIIDVVAGLPGPFVIETGCDASQTVSKRTLFTLNLVV